MPGHDAEVVCVSERIAERTRSSFVALTRKRRKRKIRGFGWQSCFQQPLGGFRDAVFPSTRSYIMALFGG